VLARELGRDVSAFFSALLKLAGTAETRGARLVLSNVETGRGPSLTFGLNSSSYLLKSYGSSSRENGREDMLEVLSRLLGRSTDGLAMSSLIRVRSLIFFGAMLAEGAAELVWISFGVALSSENRRGSAMDGEATLGGLLIAEDASVSLRSGTISLDGATGVGDSSCFRFSSSPSAGGALACAVGGSRTAASGGILEVRPVFKIEANRSARSALDAILSVLLLGLCRCALDSLPLVVVPDNCSLASPGSSSSSSWISSRRPPDGEGEAAATCIGKLLAREVSLRASAEAISKSVSYGEYFSRTSCRWTLVRTVARRSQYRDLPMSPSIIVIPWSSLEVPSGTYLIRNLRLRYINKPYSGDFSWYSEIALRASDTPPRP
jgi:hypothetical protein